jgi:hypothetical protein
MELESGEHVRHRQPYHVPCEESPRADTTAKPESEVWEWRGFQGIKKALGVELERLWVRDGIMQDRSKLSDARCEKTSFFVRVGKTFGHTICSQRPVIPQG